MSEGGSLASLLALLLDIEPGRPVAATPNFTSWLGGASAVWPPVVSGGLWLIDTLDRAAHDPVTLGRLLAHGQFDAALITASNLRGVRRLVQRLRRPHCIRVRTDRVARVLNEIGNVGTVRVVEFDEGCHAPTDFAFEQRDARGAAFLVTRKAPFEGSVWRTIAGLLGVEDLDVRWFDLRDRGAAVIGVNAASSSYVVRVVLGPDLQSIVRRNHETVEALGRILESSQLATLLPQAVAIEECGSSLILIETRLPGVLAWKVAGGELSSIIHRNALAFLRQLREETTRTTPLCDDELRRIVGVDRRRVQDFVAARPEVRTRLLQELEAVEAALHPTPLYPYLSHGDFGYGNLLVDPDHGGLLGVIDWDTARTDDIPGMDRINLELQLARVASGSFAGAVRVVWIDNALRSELERGNGIRGARALFGLAITRYITRSFAYPAIYRDEEDDFADALATLATLR